MRCGADGSSNTITDKAFSVTPHKQYCCYCYYYKSDLLPSHIMQKRQHAVLEQLLVEVTNYNYGYFCKKVDSQRKYTTMYLEII